MLKIKKVEAASDDEWDEMWHSSEYGTYYHSREWAEVWNKYTEDKIYPVPKLIIFSDNKKVVLPVMQQNYYGGTIRRYALTGPPFVSKYGNWLNSEALTKEHTNLLVSFIIAKYRNLVWQLNPFDKNTPNIKFEYNYIFRLPHFAYMIDLTKGENKIYSGMKKSCRNQIKQGIKNKLQVKEAHDITEWKKYYEIYQDTVNRWGSKAPYILDWKLFEIIYNMNSDSIKLWITWYNNIPIAGCVTFYSNRKIVIWHSASLTAYQHLRPVNLSRYEIIKDGINKNYCWLDFGTDGGNEGLRKFKESFGPDKVMCDKIYRWHPVLYHLVRAKNYIQRNFVR